MWAPIDAPMAEFGGLWPGYVSSAHHGDRGPGYGHPFLREGEFQRGHIYSLVNYNNFATNFLNAHPGEFLTRYAFGTLQGDWRDGRARQFGWNAATPPQTVWMRGPSRGSLPLSASFCQFDAPNVMLLTLKRAEDGRGLIARLIETEGVETRTTVNLPYAPILHAFEANVVEENQRALSCSPHAVTVSLAPFAICTIRLILR